MGFFVKNRKLFSKELSVNLERKNRPESVMPFGLLLFVVLILGEPAPEERGFRATYHRKYT